MRTVGFGWFLERGVVIGHVLGDRAQHDVAICDHADEAAAADVEFIHRLCRYEHDGKQGQSPFADARFLLPRLRASESLTLSLHDAYTEMAIPGRRRGAPDARCHKRRRWRDGQQHATVRCCDLRNRQPTRTFLQDGDELILRARARRDGFATLGFGDCSGVVLPAPALA